MEWTYMRGAGIAIVAALALGLAGCSSSTSDDPPMDDTAMEESELDKANREAEEAEKRAEEAEEALKEQEEADRKKAEADDAKTRTKLGKDMYAALDGPDVALPTVGPIYNNPGYTLTDTALEISMAAAGAGALPTGTQNDPATLDIGDSVGSLGGWNGFKYSHTDPESGVVNEAVIYTNRGPGKPKTFADTEHVIQTADDPSNDHIKGYVTLDEGEADTLALVRADALTHSGTQTHQPAPRTDAVYIRGTYDDIPGEYRCAGTCSSTNDGKDGPSELTGNWHFKPDPGAVVHLPDPDYLWFGWWVHKDKDGMPLVAHAYSAWQGDIPDGKTVYGIKGTATYVGHAAGLFALNNPLDGTGDGGHFTADAKLDAKFGDNSVPDAGLSGTIDNFRLNDGTEDPGWSVELKLQGWAGSGLTRWETSGADSKTTVWSIDGNEAARSGNWRGQKMYDEKPGNPPAGDGSNVPTSLTGWFYTEFNDQGRMVGAFGADRQ